MLHFAMDRYTEESLRHQCTGIAVAFELFDLKNQGVHMLELSKFFIMPLLISIVASAANVDQRPVQNKIAEIQYELTNNRDRFSQEDLDEILRSLDKALDRAQNPNGGNNSTHPACMSAAYNYGLRGDSLAKVCRRSTEHSSSCMSSAYNYNLRGEEIVEACQNSPSEFVSSCFSSGYNYNLRNMQLARLCSQIQDNVQSCLSSAYNYNLRGDQLVVACSRGNSYSNSCFSTGYNYNLRGDSLVELCRRPNSGTASCVSSAYNQGLRDQQIVNACGGD